MSLHHRIHQSGVFGALFLALLLGACSRPLYCPDGGWERAGYTDGTGGLGLEFFDRYEATCGDSGRPTDREAWVRGYERGITRYCTVRNAYRRGARGYGYFNVHACPAEDAERLDEAFYQGVSDYEVIEDQRLLWRNWLYGPYYWPYYPLPFY